MCNVGGNFMKKIVRYVFLVAISDLIAGCETAVKVEREACAQREGALEERVNGLRQLAQEQRDSYLHVLRDRQKILTEKIDFLDSHIIDQGKVLALDAQRLNDVSKTMDKCLFQISAADIRLRGAVLAEKNTSLKGYKKELQNVNALLDHEKRLENAFKAKLGASV